MRNVGIEREEEIPKEGRDIPAGIPTWITTDLIELTIEVWQPYYSTPLSTDDAITMILATGRMFDVLRRG